MLVELDDRALLHNHPVDVLAVGRLCVAELLRLAGKRYKTRQTLRKEAGTFERVANALIALRKEMAEHGVVLSDGDHARP